MLFRSIRWRLAVTYVLLALLAVALVGALALSLVRQYVDDQERSYLKDNAEVIAAQAAPLLWPKAFPEGLDHLAKIASFLGDARVRILDPQQRTLADSGPREPNVPLIVLKGLSAWKDAENWKAQPMAELYTGKGVQIQPFELAELPEDTLSAMLFDDPWGKRFEFVPPAYALEVHGHASAHASAQGGGAQQMPPLERSTLSVTIPIATAGVTLGYIDLSDGPATGAAVLATIREAFFWAGGIAALVALLLSLLVSRRLTRPIYALAGASASMARGDLSARAPSSGDDEIGRLSRQFNEMAARLQSSFVALAAERDALQRFIADASHELRTPITALRTFNELLRGQAAGDGAAQSEFLAESHAQIRRLEWITANLLDLSRLDAGLARLELESCQADELLETAARPFLPRAAEQGVTLELGEQPLLPRAAEQGFAQAAGERPPASAAQEELATRCDRTRVELALANLIDNALKFTPAGGRVQLGALRVGTAIRLWVRDSGYGIGADDLPRIFERFYRGAGHAVEGSGLGLAIVQSIAQAHGGRVGVESRPGQGSCFMLDLPGHT